MGHLSTDPASGTRDFLPSDVAIRESAFATIREVVRRHGFDPLDTPSFERLEVLTGKYGEEGDQLIFKILKRGEQEASGEADLALRRDREPDEYRAALEAIRAGAARLTATIETLLATARQETTSLRGTGDARHTRGNNGLAERVRRVVCAQPGQRPAHDECAKLEHDTHTHGLRAADGR